MKSLRFIKATVSCILLSALCSCDIPAGYYSVGYGPGRTAVHYGGGYRSSYVASRTARPQPQPARSKAYTLAANGKLTEAKAAAENGEGTMDDVEQGHKAYQNSMAATALILGFGAAMIKDSMTPKYYRDQYGNIYKESGWGW